MDFIKKHNAKQEGYELGLNEFADLSSEEFDKMKGLKVPDNY